MSQVALIPYLFFTGNAREAMEFYHSVFGGELTIQTMADAMGPDSPNANNVMHAKIEGGMVSFMASDSDRTTPYETCRIDMSLNGSDAALLTDTFHKLAEGGEVTSALKVEPWGDTFGTLSDKFGIDWMVNIGA